MAAAPPDWKGLHQDLLISIADEIKLYEDFITFRMVCKSWDAAASSSKKIRHLVPRLILAEEEVVEKEEENSSSRRQIYSLSKDRIVYENFNLPEVVGKKCFGLAFGWILVISPDGNMNMFHRITRSRTDLPHRSTIIGPNKILDHYEPLQFLRTAALSGNPLESPDFMLMVLHSSELCIAYWRPGDESWTSSYRPGIFFEDLVFYKDHFYAVLETGCVWVLEVSCLQTIECREIVTLRRMGFNCPKIVASSEGLLVFGRAVVYHGDIEVPGSVFGIEEFKIIQINGIEGEFKTVESLGERAIFIGNSNTSLCLDLVGSDFPGIKHNHIYFCGDGKNVYEAHDMVKGEEVGSYSVEDDNIKRFVEAGVLSNSTCPPFWLIHSL